MCALSAVLFDWATLSSSVRAVDRQMFPQPACDLYYVVGNFSKGLIIVHFWQGGSNDGAILVFEKAGGAPRIIHFSTESVGDAQTRNRQMIIDLICSHKKAIRFVCKLRVRQHKASKLSCVCTQMGTDVVIRVCTGIFIPHLIHS